MKTQLVFRSAELNVTETYESIEKAKNTLYVFIGTCDAFGIKIETASIKAPGCAEAFMIKNGVRYNNFSK